MSARIQAIKGQLADSHQYLNAILDGVGDRWEMTVYSEGLEWTARQVINHLADAERGHFLQVTNIAEGRSIIPEDFDIERYNRGVTRKTVEKTAEEAHAELETSRQRLNAWLDSLDENKLDMKGRHATLQILTIEQILSILAGHERGHAGDLARALGIEV
jgi:uncharacterized damage-inducible protein DinB